MPDLMFLHKQFIYCQETGKIFNRIRRMTAKRGAEAGCIFKSSDGQVYRLVSIKNERYLSHRVIWFMHFGEIPDEKIIDHLDGNGLNNRLANLRIVDDTGNAKNSSVPSHNTSGVIGVYWLSDRKMWRPYIYVNGKGKMLRRTKSLEEAIKIRAAAELEFGFHQNHGRLKSATAR